MFPFFRSIGLSVILMCAAGSSSAAGSSCGALDQAVTEKLKPMIEQSDPRSTALAGAVMKDLSWARMDCREGRLDRAEAGYRHILDALRGQPTAQAHGLPAWDFSTER